MEMSEETLDAARLASQGGGFVATLSLQPSEESSEVITADCINVLSTEELGEL
jgi:hypothetical protein